MTRKLTAVEADIVAFVGSFCALNRYCPSTREIGEATGLKSTVWAHLHTLRRDGFLLYEDGKNRTVRPAA